MGNGRGRQAGSLVPSSNDAPHCCRTRHNNRTHLKTTSGTASSDSRCGTGIRGHRNPTPQASNSAAPHAHAGPFLPPVCPLLPPPSWVGSIIVASNWTSTVNDAYKEEKDENEEQPKPITLYELVESSGFRDEEREEKRRSTKAAAYETHEIRKNFVGSKS
ncbi:hypothetical protein Ancab_010646 [Ancistrocladus abbreviatus]